MATERTTDIILRAQVDKALQPLDQVLQRVKSLSTVLDEQRAAAAKGDTTLGEYAKALRDVENAAKDLLRARTALNTFQDKQATLDAKNQAVDVARQARDLYAQTIPLEPSKAQEKQLQALERALKAAERQATTASVAFEKAAAEIERMQVAVEQLDQTHAQITMFRDMAADALVAGNAVNETLATTLRAAKEERTANEGRIADREKILRIIAKVNNALKEEAETAVKTAATEAEARQTAIDRVNAHFRRLSEAARIAAEEEVAATKAAAEAAATAQIAADERAAEAKAKMLRQANVGIGGMVAQKTASDKAADDKAEETAANNRARLIQAVRTAENAADKQDYLDRIKAEDTLANKREKDARDFQKTQNELRAAVASVWEQEAEDNHKAFTALEAYEASVAKLRAQATEAVGRAGAAAGALGAPVVPSAPLLADEVRKALGTAPGAAAGGGTLAGLQKEIADVTAAVIAGGGAITHYKDELKNLDAISSEIVRQSKIIDAFQQQKEAARQALIAVHDLTVEIKALEAEAGKAETPDQLAEVTSKIADARRRLGSVEGGTGLAAQAREEIEAFSREEKALNAIGVAAGNVTTAMRELTAVAVSSSAERQTIMAEEKKNTDAAVDDILARTARLGRISTAPPPPTALSQVTDVAGPGRGRAPIDDVTAAVEKLDASVGKGRLTAQSYNKTMDELFAIQHQIATDASSIDHFNKQTDALIKANDAFVKAQAEVNRLAIAVKAGTASLNELQAAESKMASTSAELQKQATAHAAIGAELGKRRIDTANLTGETNKLVTASARLAEVQNRVQQGSGKIFGLSSYQFQNLQFQVNDVITQLSLGQGLLRTFESQAGQIFQIFDLSAAALARFVFIAGPAIAALLVIGASLLRLKQGVDTMREFTHQLTLSADGGQYTAKSLLEVARTIEAMGVSFDEAKEAVKGFVHDGLNTDAMVRFGRAARELSDATGTSFKDALKAVSVIATGTRADIMKLDESLNFLTASQAEAIKVSFEFADGMAGRQLAFDALNEKLRETTKEGIDPFTKAMRELTEAWHNFLDAIASVGLFNFIAKTLNGASFVAKEIAADMRYIFGDTLPQQRAEAAARVTILTDRLDRLKTVLKSLKDTGTPDSDPTIKRLTEDVIELTKQLDAAKIAKYNLAQPLPGDGSSSTTTAPGGGTATVPTSKESVAAQVIAAMRAENFNNAAIATVLASIQHESQFDPMLWNKERTDYGLFQYSKSAGRYQDLAAKTGSETPTAEQQIKYFLDDIRAGIFKPVGDMLRALPNTAEGAAFGTREFTKKFEIPKDKELRAEERAPTGVAYFNRFSGSDFLTPGATEADKKRQQELADRLARERINAPNPLLRGAERLESDFNRIVEFYKKTNEDALKETQGRPLSPQVQQEIDAKVAAFAKSVNDLRNKQIEDAQKAVNDQIKSAQDAVDKSNKTDPEAQRRVVDSSFEQRLEAINIQIRNGASDVVRSQLEGARDALLKLRDQEREKVTIESDRAIVDTLTKARDESVKKIMDDFHTGAIVVGDMYRKLAEVNATFGPKIKEAIARSNADLARQPQTPAIQEQIAKNALIDPTAARQTAGDADKSTVAERNRLLTARAAIEKANQDLVEQGAITQVEANKRIEQSYKEIKPQIIAINEVLLKQIEIQYANGKITPEVYQQMRAEIELTTASATGLTKVQRDFQKQMENVVVGAAITGFETLADHISKVATGIESWNDALKGAGVAFGQFVASVLKGIAEIILKEELLAVIKGITNAISGGVGSIAGGAASGLVGGVDPALPAVYHSGGLASSPTAFRSGISPLVFLNAPRMHNGGLASDEVAMVLKKDEEVLTADDPRHQRNGGKQQSREVTSTPNIRQVLVMDPSQVSAALAGSHGEKVIVTHIKNNAGAIRGILNQR